MLLTLVSFSTNKFAQESLAKAKSAQPFFITKNGVLLNKVKLKRKNIFYQKNFFHIPPTENHSFQYCFITVNSYACVVKALGNKKSQFIKERN